MIVEEAPGVTELAGERPFSGRAGEQLDIFLEKIEVSRDEIYITSVLKKQTLERENQILQIHR